MSTASESAGEANEAVGTRVRVPKMAELVASQLRRQIVRGELREGASLPSEAALVEQFGVSRPTLREAFRVLEAESLIAVRRGANGGGRVKAPDQAVAARHVGLILQHGGTTLADVYDARVDLEAPCAAALALRRSDQDLVELRRAADTHDALVSDPAAAVRAHTDFHALVVRLAGNQTVALLCGLLGHIIETANLSRVAVDGGSDSHARADHEAARTHRRLIELVEASDATGAEELWRRHLLEGEQYLLQGDETTTVLDLFADGKQLPAYPSEQ